MEKSSLPLNIYVPTAAQFGNTEVLTFLLNKVPSNELANVANRSAAAALVNGKLSNAVLLLQYASDIDYIRYFLHRYIFIDIIPHTHLSDAILEEVILRVYVPSYSKYDKLLATYDFAARYPDLNVDAAFNGAEIDLTNIDTVMDYLHFLVGEQFAPQSAEYNNARTRFYTGREFAELSTDQLWAIIDKLKTFDFGITEPRAEYSRQELVEAISLVLHQLTDEELKGI